MLRSKNLKHLMGFTLIELLVVIAIIALLAAILVPAVTRGIQKGRVTQIISNGRSIYTVFFSAQLDNPLGLQTSSGVGFPVTGGNYDDSTTFFATVITNKKYNLTYNFFAAPGIKPANSEAEFTDSELRNAWSITLDVDETTEMTTPVLFTQNIELSGREINQFQSLGGSDGDAKPFGDESGIVVYMGGSSFTLDPDTAVGTNFNPIGAIGIALYPKNGQL